MKLFIDFVISDNYLLEELSEEDRENIHDSLSK